MILLSLERVYNGQKLKWPKSVPFPFPLRVSEAIMKWAMVNNIIGKRVAVLKRLLVSISLVLLYNLSVVRTLIAVSINYNLGYIYTAGEKGCCACECSLTSYYIQGKV